MSTPLSPLRLWLAYVLLVVSVLGLFALWSWTYRIFVNEGDPLSGLLVVGLPAGLAYGFWAGVRKYRSLQRRGE